MLFINIILFFTTNSPSSTEVMVLCTRESCQDISSLICLFRTIKSNQAEQLFQCVTVVRRP